MSIIKTGLGSVYQRFKRRYQYMVVVSIYIFNDSKLEYISLIPFFFIFVK